jgi:purine nucleoside phosphorylase
MAVNMGRLCDSGMKMLEGRDDLPSRPRIGLVLGTGWSNPDVLREQGFVIEAKAPFSAMHLDSKSGAGHPNAFLLGTWHGKDVVISQGRFHLYQEHGVGENSLIRRWMSLLLYFMNGSKQLVIASAVGGLSKKMKEDMIVMPTGIVSAHLPQPYLIGGDGEFVMSEQLLWTGEPGEVELCKKATEEEHCFQPSPSSLSSLRRHSVFWEALVKIGQPIHCDGSFITHYVIPGPGFGGATERKLWASWGFDTVGMSLDPELRLVALENLDNRPKGIACAYHETDIRVFPALFISDAHDLANNDEIVARAKAMAPNFGKFLSHVIQSEW